MTSPRSDRCDEPLRAYLVERYVTPAAADELPALVARTSVLCADASRRDAGTQYLYSAYLPGDDTCFCLFRASSSDAVRALNDYAGFDLDRITEATLFIRDGVDTSISRRPTTP